MSVNSNLFFKPRFLLAINLLTLLILVLFLLRENYPHRFLNKFKNLNAKAIPNDKVPTKKELSEMNKTFQPTFKDFIGGGGEKVFKVLVIGNSLVYHGIAEKIGWTHESGMAASDINKDYVHLLLERISFRLPHKKIIIRVSNFAEFERNPNSEMHGMIDSLIHFNPDILVFQLGENVNEDNLLIFKKRYTELITLFKTQTKSIVICSTPFFPSLAKNNIIQTVAINTNSFLVDLSNIVLLDNTNYAINESNYGGDKSQWKVSGIGMHPGDKGMKNIADQLFVTINGLIEYQLDK